MLKAYTLSSTELRANIESIYEKPLSLSVTFYMPPPKYLLLSGLWRNTLPTGKPDVDNLCKALFDTFSKVLFNDDKQITNVYARKVYDPEPHIKIVLKEATIDTISSDM